MILDFSVDRSILKLTVMARDHPNDETFSP